LDRSLTLATKLKVLRFDDTENVRKLNIRVRKEKKKKVLGNTQLSSAQ